jgi:hypothetical protein
MKNKIKDNNINYNFVFGHPPVPIGYEAPLTGE